MKNNNDKTNSGNSITRREFAKRLAASLGGASLLSLWPFTAFGSDANHSEELMGAPYINDNKRTDKPNLLFIYTDQQRPYTMKAYGNNFIDTPNLNRLASESVVCKNFYVTQPVCSPSKASLQTGLYPHQSGVTNNNIPLDKDISTIPELVDDPDYRTAYFGKWHLGNENYAQHGYQQWASTEDIYSKYNTKGYPKSKKSAYYHWLKSKGFTPSKGEKVFSRSFSSHLPLKYSKSTFLREKTVDFMRENKDNPFICCVSILNPHTPYFGPLNDYYSPHDIQLSPNVSVSPSKNEPLWYRLIAEGHKRNKEAWRKLIAKYYGLITQVDVNIGGILRELESLGLKDNTIVAFTSDHGAMLGSHNMMSKKVMYEESCKVPFLLRDPANNFKNFSINNPVSNINVVPTLLRALNKSNVDYSRFPGFSLSDFIKGGRLKHDHVFIEWTPNYKRKPSEYIPNPGGRVPEKVLKHVDHQSVRTVVSPSGWKLTISDNDKNQLYNLQEDPYELNNLYYTGKHNNVIQLLFGKIRQWQKRTNDKLNLNAKV